MPRLVASLSLPDRKSHRGGGSPSGIIAVYTFFGTSSRVWAAFRTFHRSNREPERLSKKTASFWATQPLLQGSGVSVFEVYNLLLAILL
jgi:hypothetical protein